MENGNDKDLELEGSKTESETAQEPEQTPPQEPKKFDGAVKWLKSYWWVVCSVVILVAVGAGIIARHMSIVPVSGGILMETKADFAETGEVYITGAKDMTAEEIAAAVSINPDIKFTVQQGDKRGEFILVLENPENHPYQVQLTKGIQGQDGYFSETYSVNGKTMTVQFANGTRYSEWDAIVLKFSEQVDIESLEKNLKIEPATPYSLFYDRFEVTIYPEAEWNLSDSYTISIDSDYTSMNGRKFVQPQTLVFRVPWDRIEGTPYVDYAASRNYVINEARDMTLHFDADHLADKVPVKVDTYRMPSLEKYREQGHIYLNYDIALDSLEMVESNAYLVENGENKLDVPHAGEGAYIVSAKFNDPATGEEVEVRTGYLVTALSVYLQASGRETVLWLNSAREDVSVTGHKMVYGEGDGEEIIGTTDAQGVLVIPNDEEKERNNFSIFDKDGKLVYYDNVDMSSYYQQEERFYSYLFTDRTLYKPEDTISFWGYVKPFRNNKNVMPGNVTVRFDADGLDMTVDATIDAAGVFSGEIPLERIRSSQYSIQAELSFANENEGSDDSTVVFETQYLSVQEYVKPSYTLSSTTDEKYYGPDGNVTVKTTAAFYDGTPLPRFPLEIAYYDMLKQEWIDLPNVTTDDKGSASFTFPASTGGSEIGEAGPTSNNYKVQIASDGESVTHMGNYTVFQSDIIVETKLERQPDGKNLALTVNSYKLDLKSPLLAEELEKQPYWWWISNKRLLEIAKGEPVDVDVEVSLRWDYQDNRGIRHRYINDPYYWGEPILFSDNYSLNYIKTVNPNINIIEDPNTSEKKVTLRTQNGTATVTDLVYLSEGSSINFEKNAYGYANATYKDSWNNTCETYAYYSSYGEYMEDWEQSEPEPIEGYSFQITNLSTGEDISPIYAYYQEVRLGVGESARFTLRLDGVPVEAQGGKIFYSIIHDGLYEYNITESTSFDIKQLQDFSSFAKLVAVYFDGNGVRRTYDIELVANMDSMELDIEVTPDKDAYRPGDNVNLAVKATTKDGGGVAGNMCVAVVDESIFALSEQYLYVLSDLYADIRSVNNYVTQYFTTYRDETQHPLDGGKGDGAGVDFYDSYRSNFKDTALFLPVRTDQSGNANVSFTLPDNTTSWRITAVEVGDDLRAGQHKSNIISTLPFFTKPVFTSKYIDGDDFTMLVQGHGTLLDDESEISYSVTVTGDGYNETKTAEGKAFEPQEINFGKLPIGQYKVVAKSQFDGYSDTVELPMSVIKSNLELVINKAVDLNKLDISATRFPVTITMYDKENEAFVASISSMFGHYCMQTSQRLSRVVAKKVIRDTMPGEDVPAYVAETSENIADMQNIDGGIGHYIGGTSDPLLTAYVLMVSPDQFNNKWMKEYFEDQLQSVSASSSDAKIAAACRLGLAVLGEITEAEITAELEKATATDVKAYYIAALAKLGETSKAEKLYNEQLAPKLQGMEERNNKGYRYWDVNETELAWERDTAAIWVAASILGNSDADRISLYFGQSVWRYRTLYECMIYVTSYDKPLTPMTATYTMLGESHSLELGYAGMKTLVLSRSEMESIRFTNVPEKLKAVAYYVGEPSEMGLEQSENMSISKSVTPIDDITWEVALNVKLTDDAPKGQYDISDWVPSNTRLYGVDYETNSMYFSVNTEGQKLYVTFHNDTKKEKTVKFTYRIRKTSSGEAVLDTVYMIHGDSGENCNSEKAMFTIE